MQALRGRERELDLDEKLDWVAREGLNGVSDQLHDPDRAALLMHDRLGEMVADIVGIPEVDAVIDAVGFEARWHSGGEAPATLLNQMMEITCVAGSIGAPRLYVTSDPGASETAARTGNLSLRLGEG